ncbi:MAG: hypothetical protein L5655_08955 [Thermosediminibacteraceae bacterium]|nr:hypothetical protein [Thermosediminibacteraceae bacterium]
MWHIISNPIVKKSLAVFLTGLVIKLTDDFIDREYDILLGKRNLADVLEAGILPYVILIFSLACLLEPHTSISLFFSSYIIGMTTNYNAKMPSGLYGYQESVIIFFMGIFIFGYIEMISSLFTIAAIQFWDDYRDSREDVNSRKNLANLLGKVECILFSIICLLSALYLDPSKAIAAFFSAIFIVYITYLLLRTKEVSENS